MVAVASRSRRDSWQGGKLGVSVVSKQSLPQLVGSCVPVAVSLLPGGGPIMAAEAAADRYGRIKPWA